MEYLLKSILLLLVFLLVYKVFLQRETLYHFNRFFLLFAVLASFLIPLNTIEIQQEQSSLLPEQITEEAIMESRASISDFNGSMERSQLSYGVNWLEIGLWSAYALGCFAMFLRLVFNLKVIHDKISKNVQVRFRGETLILLEDGSLPHSFLQWIFVNKPEYESNGVSEAVFAHEQAHVKGKHSLDILFIELLLIPFWFHPGLHWIKKSIQLNHEFIADQKVLESIDSVGYQQELLFLLQSTQDHSLVSQFGFGVAKKRLQMMNHKTKPTMKFLKIFVLIPLVGILIFGFSSRKYVPIQSEINLENELGLALPTESSLKVNVVEKGLVEVNGQRLIYSDFSTYLKQNPQIEKIDLYANSELEMRIVSDIHKVMREAGVNRMTYHQLVEPKNSELIGEKEESPETISVTYIEIADSAKVQAFDRDVTAYHKRLKEGEHFVFRSEEEQEEIMEIWSDLGGRYFRLSAADKKKVARPNNPIRPYVRLELDGEVYYKLKEDLTEEEIASFPPPPPPQKAKLDSVPMLAPPPPPPAQPRLDSLQALPAPPVAPNPIDSISALKVAPVAPIRPQAPISPKAPVKKEKSN